MMRKFLLFLALPLLVCCADEINISFKNNLKGLNAKSRSDTVFVSKPSSLKLDGANVGKEHTWVGQHFYIFGDKARALAGKKLQLKAMLRREAGEAPVGAGYRVFGNGNKLMVGKSQNFSLKEVGKWEEITVDLVIPPLSGIENFNVGFGFRQDGKVNNVVYVDEIRVVSAKETGMVNKPSDSLGAAQLLLNKEPLVLVKEGKPQFKIITDTKATPAAYYAAQELQEHIKLMTGVKVEISHDQNYNKPAVWIGSTAMSRKYGVAPEMLPLENIVVARAGNAVILSGGDTPNINGGVVFSRATIALGTMDATYDFLENVFNCRWYVPGKNGTVAPKCTNLSIKRLFRTGAPAYDCRSLFYDVIDPKEVSYHEVMKWQRRNRLGGSSPDPIGMHSFREWPARYGKTHPEYFALQPSGKRKVDGTSGTHLCLTNPEVVQKAAEYAIEAFKKNPKIKFFNIMPGDCNDLYYCRCAKCQAEVTPEKGRAGVHSNGVWRFVNKVAAIVGQHCPGKYIKCCAYADYLRKPDVALLPNVAVTLCFGNQTRANLESYKMPWRKLIDEWRATGARLYVWEYWCNPRSGRGIYGAPALFPRQMQEIFLIDRTQVSGRVLELANILSNGVSTYNWADWRYDTLDLYFSMKLMWNPDLDVEAELDRYYETFYGPVAPLMREFHDELEKAWLNSVWMQNDAVAWDWEVCWQKAYPPAFVDRMMGLLRKAVRETEGKEPYNYRVKQLLEGYLPFEQNSMMFRGVKADSNKTLEVPKAVNVKIDGQIEEAEWGKAAKIGGFRDSFGVYKVNSTTDMMFQHDGKLLYVAVKAGFPQKAESVGWLPAKLGKRDSYLWDYESAELFFAGKGKDYFQFIIAPDNALMDAAWIGGKTAQMNLSQSLKWNPDVKFATTRTNSGWTAELAIPLEALKKVGTKEFRVDFARNHYYLNEKKTRNWEQSMWLPTYSGFHNLERYGKMVLK